MEIKRLESGEYDSEFTTVDLAVVEKPDMNNAIAEMDYRKSLQSACEGELFLGNISSHINFNQLRKMRITHILVVHEHLKPLYPKHFKYLTIEANDSEKQNLIEHFKYAIEFIEEARSSKGSVLVHW